MNRDEKGRFEVEAKLSGKYQDLYEEYAEWTKSTVNNDRTETRLNRGVRAWLYWCQEQGVNPNEAGEDHVRQYVLDLQKEDYADTYVTRRVGSVSKYYHFLDTDPTTDLNINNPTTNVKLRKEFDIKNTSEYVRVLSRQGKEDIIAPSYGELKPIFENVPGKTRFTQVRNQVICRLLWQTAVRSEELSRIKLRNVDFEERDIKLRSAKLNRDDHPKLYHRHVWWESNIDYLMKRWEQKRAQKDPDGKSPYLLISDAGEQLSPSYISRLVKESAHNAGIQSPLVRDVDGSVKQWLYTAHRLRHSRISHLANETEMDLNYIRMMAGHAQMDTTLWYVDPDWDSAKNAYRKAVD